MTDQGVTQGGERGDNTSITYHQARGWRYEDAHEPQLLVL